MKKHKDFLWTLLGIAVMASLIFAVYQSKQPAPMELDLSEQTQTSEHVLVGAILADTEAFAEAEDTAAVLQSSTIPTSAPLPVAGASFPVAWDSQPAPTMDQVELSPSLQRSLAASAPLRTEAYSNPASDLNLQRVSSLRDIRQKRQEAK